MSFFDILTVQYVFFLVCPLYAACVLILPKFTIAKTVNNDNNTAIVLFMVKASVSLCRYDTSVYLPIKPYSFILFILVYI